ncbi:LemA family protein [Stieleria varia]|uniref:LemA family protein n=1 Tax=Stieleria varia TaxID=2528005 RepID=A0A5C6AQ27_9BACT|nr:LemA family protein [Stieleria varia]TWU02143.1 LemA family protein [Stieleria varia]
MVPGIVLACVAGVALGLAGFVVKIYNLLVSSSQQATNGFAQIEVQLKRRHDLIPSLVEATRAFLGHERETLEAVIKARQQASSNLANASGNLTDATAMKGLATSEGALMGAMGRLSMVIESYPDLKANETVANLMEELTSTENRISFARQLYNDLATNFNIQRRCFPTVVVASSVGFGQDLSMLQFDDSAELQHAPKVELVAAGV